jgi:hypothetical protein
MHKKYRLFWVFLAAAVILLILYRNQAFKVPETAIGFDRNTSKLIYTKHARCRMDCRHIDEAEVKEILQKGEINYSKSDPAARPDPKYALEGQTRDGQLVRIVFAPTSHGMVVITAIDLQREWACAC